MMRAILFLAVAMLAIPAAPCYAEFPGDRPLRIVTPYGAGGGIDIAVRILSSVGQEHLGTRVDVVNMPGAGGLTAASFVAEAEPDGYTLLISDYTPLVTLPMRENTPYAASDWVAIAQVAEIAPTFVVHERSGYASLADLLASARARPGKLAATHGTFMSSSHLPLLRLQQIAGVDFNQVPTSGGGETFQFLLGNVVQLAVTTPATIAGAIRTGNVLPVAVATADRVPALPDTPTLREAGFDIVMPVWYTIFASKQVPEERVRLLSERIEAAYATEESRSLAARAGLSLALAGHEAAQEIYLQTTMQVAETLSNIDR